MPPPTREQFEAAAKKVIASAPDGLTKDQLFDLIDKEITNSSYHPVNILDRSKLNTQELPEHEPDTWWGGFTKSLKDQAKEMFVDNPHLQAAAEPKRVADFLGFMLPTEVPKAVVGGFKIFGKAGREAMDEAKAIGAARGTSSIREFPKQVVNSLSKYYNMPEAKGPEAAAARFAAHKIDFPTEGVPPSGTAGAGNPEAWRDFAGAKGPGPEPFHPIEDWHPENANPEGWRSEPMPGPEPFHPLDNPNLDLADPENWRNYAGNNGPGPEPFYPPEGWNPETANPEGWRDSLPGPDPFHDPIPDWHPETANPEGWRQAGAGAETGVPGGEAAPPAEPLSSHWPPDGPEGDWHSGAEKGSPEAARAQGYHRDLGEIDQRYRMMTQDTKDALLRALMQIKQ